MSVAVAAPVDTAAGPRIKQLEAKCRADPADKQCAIALAKAYSAAGNLTAARDSLRGALGRAESAELHHELADVLARMNAFDDAGREYYRAAELESSEPNVFDLANFLVGHNAPNEALKTFAFGTERYPKSARMHVGAAVSHYALGEYDEAVQSLCTAVDLEPSDARPLAFLGQMYDISPAMAGEVTARLGHFVELYPQSAPANLYFGLSFWKQHQAGLSDAQFKKVESLLKRAAVLDPKLAEAHVQLGALYDERSLENPARREYEEAVHLDPSLAKAWYRLSQLYTRAGESGKASAALERFKALRQSKPAAQK